jgi:ABC-type Na+ efflux pump permease subunit
MNSRIVVALLILALVPTALAEQYWTVVDDDAPAANVVHAANFAGSMKASAGASFTGKTSSQAADALQDVDPDEVFIATFDGDSVTIAANGDRFDSLLGIAVSYLDARAVSQRDEPASPSQDGQEQETSEGQGNEPVVVIAGPEREDSALEQAPHAPSDGAAQDGEKDAEESPGLLARLWHWFVDLFE